MKKLNSLPLEMAEDENYNLHLVRGDDGITKMGLYQVNMAMGSMNGNGVFPPVLSTYFVLAEGEEGAIDQVRDTAAGGKCLSGLYAMEAGILTGVAYRLPLYIRGWGDRAV